jgi:hypothetical protein
MSVREIPYRFSQLIRKKYEEYFCTGRKLPEIPVPETRRILDNQISDKYIFGEVISPYFFEKNQYPQRPFSFSKKCMGSQSVTIPASHFIKLSAYRRSGIPRPDYPDIKFLDRQ